MGLDSWEVKNLGPSLTQEIGQELLLSVEERFQIELDDKILAPFSGKIKPYFKLFYSKYTNIYIVVIVIFF